MPLPVLIVLFCGAVIAVAAPVAALLRPAFARTAPQVKCQPWQTFSKRIVRT